MNVIVVFVILLNYVYIFKNIKMISNIYYTNLINSNSEKSNGQSSSVGPIYFYNNTFILHQLQSSSKFNKGCSWCKVSEFKMIIIYTTRSIEGG